MQAARVSTATKRTLIFIHRWLGVVLCLVFLLWFPSGIVMMYWPFPEVSQVDRLAHAAPLTAGAITLSPADAYARLEDAQPPRQVRLNTLDGRPVYRFRTEDGERIVYADTGEEQLEVTPALMRRVASAWSGQPAAAATVQALTEVDQWTVANFRSASPVWKYSWPDGQQVYVTENGGEVVQATTRASRFWAWAGAIPHWLYFTPLRQHGPEWSRVVIWTSGLGTIAAILGIVIGAWMYSPSKRYRFAGAPARIPYRGQKRWHTIFGLLFGVGAVTWAFSGLLSMDPFPQPAGESSDAAAAVPQALRTRLRFAGFAEKDPRAALRQLSAQVKQLEFTGFGGEPVYIAALAGGGTYVVPMHGAPVPEFDRGRLMAIVRQAAGGALADLRVIDDYDRYYLDRRRQRPLPVILATLNDAEQTRYYIDPRTARVVGGYRASDWVERWLYHGLHSLDFPWLYKYRPLWDIVVITFMAGGTALCVTSLILAWRVLGRRLRAPLPVASGAPPIGGDLVQ